jgi:hypothetical protein
LLIEARLLYIGREGRVKDRRVTAVRRRRRRTAVRAWALAAALASMAACTPRKAYDPFRVPRDEVRQRVRTIAISPIRLDVDVEDAQRIRDAIAELVTAKLVAGGFGVVPAPVMHAAWRRVVADVGPVFNPITGSGDKARLDLVEDAVRREVAETHHADAVLHVQVIVMDVPLARKTMRYCGIEDTTYWPWSGGSPSEHATLARGVCLVAILVDMEGRSLYAIQNGVETLETYAYQTHAARPRASRLQDMGRLRRAVDDAVGPLAQTGAR